VLSSALGQFVNGACLFIKYGKEDKKKIFQTPSSKFDGRGGDFLSKKKFCQKFFFVMKNIEDSVSKTLRQKLRQV